MRRMPSGMAVKRGLLLVFEGVDRSGKTSQTETLVQWLTETTGKAQLQKFPDRTTRVGEMIDGYLKEKHELSDQTIHLLFSANRWELRNKMMELLDEGTNVVVDRYAYSGVAFSAAKGLDLSWCKSPDIGLPKPDRVFFLKLPPEAAEERGGFGEERYEKTEFQKKVYTVYQQLWDPTWVEIDASGTREVVQDAIRGQISELLKQESLPPIKALWVSEKSDPEEEVVSKKRVLETELCDNENSKVSV